MKIDPNDSQLDRYDTQILKITSKEGRIPVTELAERIGLSTTPCRLRLARLQSEGYILGYQAILNPEKLKQDHVAFVEARLTSTTEEALSAFNAAVHAIPEIEQCHMIAGGFDYLLKVRTRDMRSYRTILGETISTLPYVAATSTYVSMQAVKDR